MLPEISVIMTAYNEEKYVKEAISSILNQTFSDFELIIINDGSTDNTENIIKSFKDKRIKLINNKRNIGAAASSNIGLEMVKGKYIARADADDIYHSKRFEKQVQFLEENQEYNICGTSMNVINEDGSEEVWKYKIENDYIKGHLVFNPHIAHPSIMMRSELLIENEIHYNNSFPKAIDYEFYTRYESILSFFNIDEKLVTYRRHQGGLTHNNSELQRYAGIVRINALKNLGVVPSEEEFILHQVLSHPEVGQDFSVMSALKWIEKLKLANLLKQKYDNNIFSEVLASKLFRAMEITGVYNSDEWDLFFNSEFSKYIEFKERTIDMNDMVNTLNEKGIRNIAIFGTLRLGQYLANKLNRKGFEIICYIDNHRYKEVGEINSIKVFPLEKVLEENIDLFLVTILGNHDSRIIKIVNETIKNQNANVMSWKEFIYK